MNLRSLYTYQDGAQSWGISLVPAANADANGNRVLVTRTVPAKTITSWRTELDFLEFVPTVEIAAQQAYGRRLERPRPQQLPKTEEEFLLMNWNKGDASFDPAAPLPAS
jgi:hypothetical protein